MFKIFFSQLKDAINKIDPKIKGELGRFWILTWYGRSTWDKTKGITLKEAILTNSKQQNYFPLNKERQYDYSIKVLIEEHYTREIPLGAILDSDGKIIKIPNKETQSPLIGLYSRNDLQIGNFNLISKSLKTDIFEYLENSKYPLYKDKSVYSGCPYFKREITFNNGEEKTTILIPIHVILQTFFYLTNFSANKLINDEEIFTYIKRIEDTLYLSSQKLKIEHAL